MAGKRKDWDSIEVEYLAGIKSIRAIASEFDCNEASIRKKAKKEGWIRNPTKAKREQVKARLAQCTQEGTQTGTRKEVRTRINEAVCQDVTDMNLVLSNARGALTNVSIALPDLMDMRELKNAMDINKNAMETIRRIRGLDDEKTGSYEDDLEALAADL